MKFVPSKRRVSQCDSDSPSSEPAVQPDHPERHDLWEPIVIARDSALTENICVGVSDCARPEIWSNIFICGREEKKEKKEEGQTREATGRTQ